MKSSIYLASGFAIVGLLIGTAFGYYLTPEYKSTMYAEDMSLGNPGRSFDLRYINAMIAHHRGAMLLAEDLQANTSRAEMKALATNILADEPKAIDELYTWKKSWYGDTRQVKDPEVPNLGGADTNFDLRFLNAIIAHHEAGIEMTKEARSKSTRSQVLDNANAVEAFLTEGLEALKGLRLNWYNI